MKTKLWFLLTLLIALFESCTVSFLPRSKEVLPTTPSNPIGSTGSLKVSWQVDTLSTVGYRLFTEATYTSLYDTRVTLQQKDNIRSGSSRVVEFVFDDLNPGNYVIEMFSRQRRANGGSGNGRT